jgi:hypothetical protein
VDDAEIRILLTRLARSHPSGGSVVERAAILAEGADFPTVMAWIVDHAGEPEATAAAAPTHGLHGSRLNRSGPAQSAKPNRFILPAGVLA